MTVLNHSTRTDSLLRLAMRADALLTGLIGVIGLPLAGWLAQVSGTTVSFEKAMSAFFIAYGVVVFGLSTLGSVKVPGMVVIVHYSGWLYDPNGADGKGSQFDSSTRSGPLTFVLGGNGVISGFNRGVLGMRVGGLRRFVLPPELAYGSSGNGPIPPNATIVFEVELTNVQ